MKPMVEVDGLVAPGFEEVRAEFARNFAERGEIGAAVAAYWRGETVVDLWGGRRAPDGDAPWNEDTMVVVMFTTKGLAAMTLALANARGLLDYDAPVARYWPEFAQRGKGAITVRQLLRARKRCATRCTAPSRGAPPPPVPWPWWARNRRATSSRMVSPLAERGAHERRDHRQRNRDLNPHQPHEVPRDLLVQRVEAVLHCLEAPIDPLEPTVHGVEAPGTMPPVAAPIRTRYLRATE